MTAERTIMAARGVTYPCSEATYRLLNDQLIDRRPTGPKLIQTLLETLDGVLNDTLTENVAMGEGPVVATVPPITHIPTDAIIRQVRVGRERYGWCDVAWTFTNQLGLTDSYSARRRGGSPGQVLISEVRHVGNRFAIDYRGQARRIQNLLAEIGVDLNGIGDQLIANFTPPESWASYQPTATPAS
jgi:hypothetical protein